MASPTDTSRGSEPSNFYATSDAGRVLRPRQDDHRDELGDRARRSAVSRGSHLEAHDRARHLRASSSTCSSAPTRRRWSACAKAMLALTKGWDHSRVKEIVRETLDQVITPVIYAEALDLIEEHKRAGRKTVIISSSPIETVEAIGEHLGVDDVIATRAPDRRRRQVHGRARVLRVRPAQGRGDPRDGGARRHRPRRSLRVLGLDHRPADARARRQSGRGESRPRTRARRARSRVGDA